MIIISEFYENDFAVTDIGMAEKAIQEFKNQDAEDERMVQYLKDQILVIGERRENARRRLEERLRPYFETTAQHVTKGGQRKFQLPSATLVLKPPKIDYKRDDAVLLEYSRIHKPDAIKVKESIDWMAWKQEIKETGIIPDGVTPVEVPEEFEVKINV